MSLCCNSVEHSNDGCMLYRCIWLNVEAKVCVCVWVLRCKNAFSPFHLIQGESSGYFVAL